ncbi:hypothetical protein [Baaleninema sp.]|uniref:hypothetical protein n=1 Tax=Baaleninema sp. TaxID=3101197 RepID=UPI003CFEF2F0
MSPPNRSPNRANNAIAPHLWTRRVRRWGALVVLGLFAVALWANRQAIVSPPQQPERPETVYVVAYDILGQFGHNSLVLPTADGFVEYSFGDRAVYAENNNDWGSLLRAVAYPTPGTLGRRAIAWDGENLEDLERELQQGNRAERYLFPVGVERDRVAALRQQIDRRYERSSATPQYNRAVGLYFVPDAESYWAFNTCNHTVVRWLKALGCCVRGSPMWGKLRMANPTSC